jgi:hypothetical protein
MSNSCQTGTRYQQQQEQEQQQVGQEVQLPGVTTTLDVEQVDP